MTYTTGSTVDIKKTLPKGAASGYSNVAANYQIEVKNGNVISTINPASLTAYVESDATTDGYITISGVTLTDGLNMITVKYFNNADSDTNGTVKIVGRLAVNKITNPVAPVVF